jgi:hypothetical protein
VWYIFGAFAKIRKATISFVMYAIQSALLYRRYLQKQSIKVLAGYWSRQTPTLLTLASKVLHQSEQFNFYQTDIILTC